jgi:hypothetical protein
MAGIQARSIDDFGLILDDIANRFGKPADPVDMKAYAQELEEAEAKLIYRSLKVEPLLSGRYMTFDITNVGNVDLELLMLEVYIPKQMATRIANYVTLDAREVLRDKSPYVAYSCYSNRGVTGSIQPVLRPVITPSMGTIRPSIQVPLHTDPDPSFGDLPIYYQIHAVGYRTEEEHRRLADVPGWYF